NLYNIVQRKEDYVGTVLQSVPLNIQFRRSLVGERWNSWLHLLRRLMDVRLSNQPDSFHWKLARNSVFTVKSMYMDLINSSPTPRSTNIWKVKVP
uniref:Reverse transcriptase zinc-binding domain-containing protein n=1 Tax=Aegilops tauschii subsp. strangulata TaxID=200361 RepID=A0A453APP2_AEGTS